MYYVTVLNEKYKMPKMPENVQDGIIKGMYRLRKSEKNEGEKVNLFGSGAILNEVIKAAGLLEKSYNVRADIWSITSYKELYDNAREVERLNVLNPDKEPVKNYIEECLAGDEGLCVAAHDYVKAIPLAVSQWFPGTLNVLGTDGFGRSDNRGALRDYFEVDAAHIAWMVLNGLYRNGKIDKKSALKARKALNINNEKKSPTVV